MKLNIQKWVFFMMFLTLSCRSIITLMPILGLPLVSTALAALCLLSQVYCFVHAIKQSQMVVNQSINLLFLVYTTFITYQLFFSGIIALDKCEGTPKNIMELVRSTVDIFILCQLPFLVSRYLDFYKFAKWTCFVILLFAFIYNQRIGFFYYPLVSGLGHDESEMIVPSGFIDGLTMGSFVGLMLCCAIFLFGKWWGHNKIISIIIPSVIIIIGMILMMMIGQRGPVLFIFITMIICMMAKGAASKRVSVSIMLIFLVVYFFFDQILSVLANSFPVIIERFSETGGSGRYGDENSIFAISFAQIMDNPFFGYHCRLLASELEGSYAHNIVLELLMTVGFVFAIPILYLLYKAFVQSYKLIKYDKPESLIGIIFVYKTLCLLTSASIVLNTHFWFSFMFVLATIKYVDLKSES